jgi:hypothetical protein
MMALNILVIVGSVRRDRIGIRPARYLQHCCIARGHDERAVRTIAETVRARFEGMPGLRSKAFTVNPGKREATNFYIWDSEDAAKAFFTEALQERVTGLYGVRPGVE